MSRFRYAWNFVPVCKIYIQFEIKFFKRCLEKHVRVRNFKYMPEFTDHDVMIKMFTFVVFNASEKIWTWQMKLVDRVIFSDTSDSKNRRRN